MIGARREQMPIRGARVLIADCFLDTTVLLYAAQGRKAAPKKFGAARQIVLEEDYSTSGQVLAEFYSAVTKKGAATLSPEKAAQWVQTLAKKPCQLVDADLVEAGIEQSREHQIDYWDGAIVAAAQRLGAKTLYSEDFEHGQTFGSVTAINPFIDI